MDQIHLEMQRQNKWQAARASAKRTAFFAVVAGLGGAITFAAIILPQSPDGIGLFIGALTASAGVGGALINSLRAMRCLRPRPPNLGFK